MIKINIISILVIIVLGLAIFGCAEKQIINEEDFLAGINFDEKRQSIEVVALGSASKSEDLSDAEAKRDAGQIAEVNAFEMLAEALEGSIMDGEYTIRDIKLDQSKLIQLIEARMNNVKKVGETKFQRQEDGSWLASVKMRMDKLASMDFVADMNDIGEVRRGVYPNMNPTPEYMTFSGIIVDLRYIRGFKPKSMPKVLGYDDKVLLSIENVEDGRLGTPKEFPVFRTYRDAVNANIGIGQQPIKLIALRVSDDSSGVYLDTYQSDKFGDVTNREELIKQGKVVFIYHY